MGRRGRKATAIAASGETREAREALERRWRDRLSIEPRLATLVTAGGGRREPFHRWIPYKQGFSPGLVRLFLSENPRSPKEWGVRPVLDPFSGSGTCATECARHGVHALGVEAIEALVFLANSKFERGFPAMPEPRGASTWQEIADHFDVALHRVALMLAVGRRHTSDGRANRGARPLEVVLGEVAAMMRDDLMHPLPKLNQVEVGDARRLETIEDGAIGGILTSPPYLSRHDYAQIAGPYETVYGHWYGAQQRVEQVRGRMTAKSPRSVLTRSSKFEVQSSKNKEHIALCPLNPERRISPAEKEVSNWLVKIGQGRLAGAVREYFEDLTLVLNECHRVLAPSGLCWVVVGGARIQDVYVPSDLMVAESAESCGFRVEAVRVARNLVGAPRKFGQSGPIAPRESLLVMRRR